MKNNKSIFIFCGIIGILIFAYYFSPANLAWGSGTVTVNATVAQTISCNVSTTTTDFGQLTTSAVSASNPDVVVTMSCNSNGGATLKIHDAGDGSNPGLYSTTVNTLVTSTSATLSAGTAGYGIQGTVNTGSGTGGTLTLNPTYDVSGDNVGGLTIADTDISSSSSPIANRETTVKHKAAISSLTPAASDYSDTITYSCVAN